MKVASTFGIMVPDENSPTEAGLVTSIIRVAPEAEGQHFLIYPFWLSKSPRSNNREEPALGRQCGISNRGFIEPYPSN